MGFSLWTFLFVNDHLIKTNDLCLISVNFWTWDQMSVFMLLGG